MPISALYVGPSHEWPRGTYIAEAFRSNWLSSVGPHIDGFEREVANRLGGVHTVAVSSGTAALHLVLRYIDIGRGDRVAVNPRHSSARSTRFSISAPNRCSSIVRTCRHPFGSGARAPDQADDRLPGPDRRTSIWSARRPRSLGRSVRGIWCDVGRDAAESLGSTYKGRQTATTAPFSILSFNGNKIITTTGGGMCVSKDAAAAPVVKKWATHPRKPRSSTSTRSSAITIE